MIVGKTSGARGRVISFQNADLKLYYVALNEIPFIQGETINGFNGSGDAISGIIDDSANSIFAGSKVITDQFELEAGQRTNFYDVSKLTRLLYGSSYQKTLGKLLLITLLMQHLVIISLLNRIVVLHLKRFLSTSWMVLLSLSEIRLTSVLLLKN